MAHHSAARAHIATRRRRSLTWRVVAACLAISAALLLSGCQISQDAVKKDPFLQELVNAQNAQSAQSQESTAAGITQSDGTLHQFGKPFQVDNTVWNVQSADAAYAIKLGDTVLTAKGEYIVVRFLFQNITFSQQPPLPDMLVIEAGSGKALHTYLADAHATALFARQMREQDFLTITTIMNQTYKFSLVFDVPRDATGLSLKFHSYPIQDQNSVNI